MTIYIAWIVLVVCIAICLYMMRNQPDSRLIEWALFILLFVLVNAAGIYLLFNAQ